jgi:hypothetical protein
VVQQFEVSTAPSKEHSEISDAILCRLDDATDETAFLSWMAVKIRPEILHTLSYIIFDSHCQDNTRGKSCTFLTRAVPRPSLTSSKAARRARHRQSKKVNLLFIFWEVNQTKKNGYYDCNAKIHQQAITAMHLHVLSHPYFVVISC